MSELMNDVSYASEVSKGIYDLARFGRLYYCSNERLNDLFSNFSVLNKNVYTVLASSDQVFYSYLNGADTVDTFDRNKLTKYYYYLRKWLIEYCGMYYPRNNILIDTNNYIKKLLEKVDCHGEDEVNAYFFWSSYVNISNGFDNNLFHTSRYIIDNDRRDDIFKLISLLKDRDLSFREEDLSEDISKDKKYDVIITSNLLEYIHDDLVLTRTRDNLYDILEDDGEIICSYVINNEEDIGSIKEKEIFSELFDVSEFPYSGGCEHYKGRPLGYSYRKK